MSGAWFIIGMSFGMAISVWLDLIADWLRQRRSR